MWSTVKSMQGKRNSNNIKTLLDLNKQPVTQDQAKADLLASSFTNISSTTNFSQLFQTHKAQFEQEHKHTITQKSNPQSELDEPFTIHELQKAIASGKNTAPGHDQIAYAFFKHMSNTSLQVILCLLDNMWRESHIPQEWKHSIIIPILKPNKDQADPTSYRPINLTSTFCKIMERIVTERLVWFLNKNKILNFRQSGFRKHHSTVDHLLHLSDHINKALATKEHTLAVFLDIHKAYDMVWKEGLLYKIHNMGISGNMFNFIKNFLTNRTMQVKVNNTLSASHTTKWTTTRQCH